jgi:hypothetical protein
MELRTGLCRIADQISLRSAGLVQDPDFFRSCRVSCCGVRAPVKDARTRSNLDTPAPLLMLSWDIGLVAGSMVSRTRGLDGPAGSWRGPESRPGLLVTLRLPRSRCRALDSQCTHVSAPKSHARAHTSSNRSSGPSCRRSWRGHCRTDRRPRRAGRGLSPQRNRTRTSDSRDGTSAPVMFVCAVRDPGQVIAERHGPGRTAT